MSCFLYCFQTMRFHLVHLKSCRWLSSLISLFRRATSSGTQLRMLIETHILLWNGPQICVFRGPASSRMNQMWSYSLFRIIFSHISWMDLHCFCNRDTLAFSIEKWVVNLNYILRIKKHRLKTTQINFKFPLKFKYSYLRGFGVLGPLGRQQSANTGTE